MPLNDYSGLFGKVRFVRPLPDALRGTVVRLSDDPSRLRNIHPIKGRNGTRFVVKYYLARVQHIFGIFGSADLETAIRLADMLIVKFHPYRQRHVKELTEDDLNLTPNQARFDIENEHDINSLLVQFFAELDEESLRPKPRVSRHKTVRQDFHAVKAEILDSIERVFKRQEQIIYHLHRLEDAQRGLSSAPVTIEPYKVTYAPNTLIPGPQIIVPFCGNPLFTTDGGPTENKNSGCPNADDAVIVRS